MADVVDLAGYQQTTDTAAVPAYPVSAAPVGLTDAQRLQAALHQAHVETAQARLAAAQAQAQLMDAQLQIERLGLEAAFRAALAPAPGSTFNWQRLAFDAPAAVKE